MFDMNFLNYFFWRKIRQNIFQTYIYSGHIYYSILIIHNRVLIRNCQLLSAKSGLFCTSGEKSELYEEKFHELNIAN
jgi:hypothetical protein